MTRRMLYILHTNFQCPNCDSKPPALIMPPQKKMYLLGRGDRTQKKHFSFVDFFPIEEMALENLGLDVISMKEYLEKEAMTGKLVNKVCVLSSCTKEIKKEA